MELGNLPVVDWDLATKLAGNKLEYAEEIMSFLMKNIQTDVKDIKNSFKSKKSDQFLYKIHKLHGAVCYTGLPRLKTILSQLETDLKNNIMESSPSYLAQLDSEVSLLLERYSHLLLKDRNGT